MKNKASISELTQTEMVILEYVRDGLISRYNKGIRGPKSSTKIIQDLKDRANIKITPARLRKIINKIRLDGVGVNLIMTATTEGYQLTNDIALIRSYCDSLESRIGAQSEILKAIKRDLAELESQKALKLTDTLYSRDDEK